MTCAWFLTALVQRHKSGYKWDSSCPAAIAVLSKSHFSLATSLPPLIPFCFRAFPPQQHLILLEMSLCPPSFWHTLKLLRDVPQKSYFSCLWRLSNSQCCLTFPSARCYHRWREKKCLFGNSYFSVAVHSYTTQVMLLTCFLAP